MFSFNNNYYCEYCFERTSPQSGVCPKCGSVYDREKYCDSLPVGHVLAGKYLVGKVLGQGGFGKTYLCFDMKRSCRVAIKEYFPESLAYRTRGDYNVYPKGDANTYKNGAKKFYKEASILVRFKDNPEIVRVEKLFMENNTSYFVMEYLTGTDLKKYFSTTLRANENLVICIAMEVLKGLKVLHAKGVLHRDIAPDNIFMCDNGTVKLIDFGASRMNIGTVTNSLSIVLKPGFAPFEQYQTKGNQGPWTDIYALGATIYYMLKRRVPPEAVARMSNPSLDMSGISPHLARIITKMMAIRPQDRYRSVTEIIPELITAQRMNTSRAPAHAPAPEPSAFEGGQSNMPNMPDIQESQERHPISPMPYNQGAAYQPSRADKERNEESKSNSKKVMIITLAIVCGVLYVLFVILLTLLFL